MKNILVPVDFSEASYEALKVATRLSAYSNRGLHLIHVVESFGFHKMDGPVKFEIVPGMDQEHWADPLLNGVPEYYAKIEKELRRLSELVRSYEILPTITITTGKPYAEIVEYANSNGINLIVMGAGENTLVDRLFGSNTQKTIRMAPCPVLAIQEDDEELFADILLVSDFKDETVNENLKSIKAITDFYRSALHVLYVNTWNDFERTKNTNERIENIMAEYGIEEYELHVYSANTVVEGILDYVEQNPVNMVMVTATQPKTSYGHAIIGVPERVLTKTNTPVMVFHPEG